MPPRIDGNIHLVLVVSEAKRSAQWYSRVFDFVVVREGVEAVLLDSYGRETRFTSSILFHLPTRFFLGLAQPSDAPTESFNWQRVGLQHFGFHVEQRSELDDWASHLDSLGIEHSPILPEGPGLLVRFHDPDKIPVEVFWADWEYCEQLWTRTARARAQSARERREQKKRLS
jgi:catechol 2,3-dioxygenase-like lactoylglutathione lyase family enzyme